MEDQTRTHFGACPHDCPDTCAMIYEVEDEKLISVKGNKEHPMTRGTLCVKVKDYEKRHYHPDRLLYPHKRVGKKGEKKFERISWEEAIDTIHSKWVKIIDEYGPQAILPFSYLGNQGLVHGLNGGDSFFNKLGATVCERTFCGEGSCTAWLSTIGPTAGVDPESYIHSKYIVIWACNSVSTNLHHWAIVQDAKKKGAKVVVIDSYKSRTAKQADWHLSPKPGTDGALAMAVINHIIENDLTDKDYIDKYTDGFEELKSHVSDKTPEWAAKITLQIEYSNLDNAYVEVETYELIGDSEDKAPNDVVPEQAVVNYPLQPSYKIRAYKFCYLDRASLIPDVSPSSAFARRVNPASLCPKRCKLMARLIRLAINGTLVPYRAYRIVSIMDWIDAKGRGEDLHSVDDAKRLYADFTQYLLHMARLSQVGDKKGFGLSTACHKQEAMADLIKLSTNVPLSTVRTWATQLTRNAQDLPQPRLTENDAKTAYHLHSRFF